MIKLFATAALSMALATGAYAQATNSTSDPSGSQELGSLGAPAMGSQPDLMDGQTRVDVSTVSADQLIGALIETQSGEAIAKVDDVIVSDTGTVENIAAKFGGILGFGSSKVLLNLDEVDFVKRADDSLLIQTNLTPASLESRPEYEGT